MIGGTEGEEWAKDETKKKSQYFCTAIRYKTMCETLEGKLVTSSAGAEDFGGRRIIDDGR